MKIKVLIIDDERYSREEIIHLLKEYEFIEVVGEADSGESGVMKTLQLQPDVLFLDIEMPKMNGIEVAKAIKECKHVPLIVFATAYPDFAVEAFRQEAIDYLLKPFDDNQLRDTITRIKRKLLPHDNNQINTLHPNKLAVEGDDEILYLHPANILYIYRDERYTKIVTKDNTYDTKTPLKDLETRLKDFSFFRIHKGYLVNLDYVVRLTPWFNGAYQLEIKDIKELLSVSRNYVKGLRARLEL
ncbi:LytR/AlgR family response regulator transcription factor [Bacillus sp. DJP31]|uniref:LytR/AlgR family response regulator transcription factor n=1 Tax=Bacillus sp. DJP31 TaxID=3409789 RepID=UPI003BB782F9